MSKNVRTVFGAVLIFVAVVPLVIGLAAFSEHGTSHAAIGVVALAVGAATMYGAFKLLAEPRSTTEARD